MSEWFFHLFPNMADKMPELWEATIQTLQMVFLSGAIAFALGLVLGVLLIVTREGGVMACHPLWWSLDKLVNLLRSIPFIILLAALIPLTRAMVGTAIGVRGAIIPLVFGTVPFFSRQVEAALAQIDWGLIEAAQSMGDSPQRIIFRVYLREGVPALARAATITFVSLIGLSAMAGSIGAGGLGDFAIRWGYQRNQTDVTYLTLIVILALVFVAQALGDYVVKKTTH
ncbi:MAG: methionine ABC transporter permease [Clostridiaceae bacterium]|nr:methionine ABC transporter permease [Clostridiaceae bacterium]